MLTRKPNYGLLLRWEAALTEMRAFRQLPEPAISDFVQTFGQTIASHLGASPRIEILPFPVLDRGLIAPHRAWDRFPTIFSFLLKKPSSSPQGAWLNPGETKKVHELLREMGYQLGQPVACGTRAGLPVKALRLCLSSRLIVDALSATGRGPQAVMADAMNLLDNAARLASLPLF